jgi:hypothetical protein
MNDVEQVLLVVGRAFHAESALRRQTAGFGRDGLPCTSKKIGLRPIPTAVKRASRPKSVMDRAGPVGLSLLCPDRSDFRCSARIGID